jgi:hypothetical protein
MTDELKCEKQIAKFDRDEQNRIIRYHERCNKPASLCKISGITTSATAVFCARHRQAAERECFVSGRGFPLGKIARKEKKGYQQTIMPGLGIEIQK